MPLPQSSRRMTANPLKPVNRHRVGKPLVESPESDEEEDDIEEQEEQKRLEAEAQAQRRRQQQQQQARQRSAAAPKPEKQQDDDEDGFVTEEEDEDEDGSVVAPGQAGLEPNTLSEAVPQSESEEESEEESSEEESSSEDEAPRVLLRPTFIKKDKRDAIKSQSQTGVADSAAENDARYEQRQEQVDQLIRDELEKNAIAHSAAKKAWDDDEEIGENEEAIDDTDGKDPEAEYAAWKLRELKRVQRSRAVFEEAEKERAEKERRQNLTAAEREREDSDFVAKQREERDASRGQTGYMQKYFHKGAFFRDTQESEGLDQRTLMGRAFVDDVARENLPQYMQIRDMTKLGKKGRTRYRDLRSEDTGTFGSGLVDNRRRRDGDAPVGISDDRFKPDYHGDGRGQGSGPTGANASVVRRRRSKSRSRSRSPRRKRSPSPYEDRDKRRRVEERS
ncbi:hypothetical protein N7495_001793 [Penicillium taxi]|uniref:uncharacterized protein n=1 Tax=Penicillium taxi TaxID=168475 RepID=UPI002545B0DD|nr:uncharacterized protein N7495_001793 [Penicillium taxi]KAJ5909111.1 hypothetical protein N7495_001793 [Penicillium taxi]